ncbi:Kelch repeat-containing protein [Desulfatibacillum aliphaticivorans]|uniref:Kelch repeat-containing protein n=1 Tax=Desulfatibacillum aliphaticivorans TaxID=218208 RepID=B8FGD9_DESAL|nr:Kelch repeat-containing protein [Desulfatibacillum aliphaticivorans]ACL03819.1 Kelch repeat-containing protein [Desulfatibacillum aliphaticivorans]
MTDNSKITNKKSTSRVWTALLCAAVVFCLCPNAMAYWENGFSAEHVGAMMAFPNSCAVVESNGVVYCIGGTNALRKIYSYDLATGETALAGALDRDMKWGFAGAATSDGVIYLSPPLYSVTGTITYSQICSYNLSTHEFVETEAGFSESIAYAGIIAGPDGYIYTYGGQTAEGYNGKIYRLDPSDESFEYFATLPNETSLYSPAIFAKNGLLYIFNLYNALYEVYSLDPSTGQALLVADISTYITDNRLAITGNPWVYEDDIFILCQDSEAAVLTLCKFDTSDNTFVDTGVVPPFCKTSFGLLQQDDTNVYFLGGYKCEDSSATLDVYKLTPFCIPEEIPYQFSSGQPAMAEEVNENFDLLLEKYNALNCELQKIKAWAEAQGYEP